MLSSVIIVKKQIKLEQTKIIYRTLFLEEMPSGTHLKMIYDLNMIILKENKNQLQVTFTLKFFKKNLCRTTYQLSTHF